MDNTDKNKMLWEWTAQHIKNKVPFLEWLPSETALATLGMELKLSREAKDNNRALLQMFLADEKYCKACAECDYNKTCYLDGTKKSILVINGNISFGKRDCEKYARF